MKTVFFTSPHGLYQPGDVAGFEDDQAASLIEAGLAIAHGHSKPDETPEPPTGFPGYITAMFTAKNGTAYPLRIECQSADEGTRKARAIVEAGKAIRTDSGSRITPQAFEVIS